LTSSTELTLALTGSRPEDSDRSAVEGRAQRDGIEELTRSMARGDQEAYRRFFNTYYPRLLRYLLVVTSGDDDASREALQGTFLRVVRHVRVFSDEEVFWCWLTRLARTALCDQGRKRGRYRAFLGRLTEQTRVEDVNDVAGMEKSDRLAEILDRNLLELAPDERELVEQKYLKRMTVEAMANGLGMTEKAVESRLVRVRRKLRQAILTELHNERRP
jgi:RNA polymerase sigma-70 factor (ECF subfamily)